MKRLLAVPMALMAVALVWGIAAASAQAAPLAPADVAAGAKWLGHIDFDAARDSKIGEHVLAKARDNEQVKKGLSKLHDELGMDPMKDLHGMTVYGTDFTQHTGVLVAYASADKEKVVSFLKSRPDFAESKDGDHDLYSWTENMGHREKHAMWASFPKTGVAVVADSADSLKAALDVVGGKGGLATSSPLLADAPKGTIIRAAVVGLTAANLPVPMPLLKQIDDVNVAIGESDGEDFAHIKVGTTGADAAKQMKSLIDGFSGMIGLQAADHPEVQKMMEGLKVDAQGKTLTIDWKASSDDIIKASEKAREGARRRRPE
jgi:hypothetical protein